MKFDWNQPLKPGMAGNPIVQHCMAGRSDFFNPTDADLSRIFGTGHSLKTWGRANQVLVGTPHWIAVHKPTPLHTDPKYPRFSHQLIVRADPGYVLRGYDKAETPLARGTAFVLDTHSPHQLCAKIGKGGFYVAVSVDMHEAVPLHAILPTLIEYGQTAEFITPEILAIYEKSRK